MRIYPGTTVDSEFKALGDSGHTGSLNDRQHKFLRAAGYTNSLADMQHSHDASVVATAPVAMTIGQWTLADSPSAGGNTLTVNIVSAPANGGNPISGYEYRRNGGSWTTLTGGTSLGGRAITVVATTLANIEVRAVNGIGGALPSDTKSATPTVASTVPATITSGQWTLADSPSAGGDTLTVNLISAPANGGSAITLYQFRRNGGAWSTLPGGTSLGTRNITVLATTLANIELRAVNGIGNAAASDTKSATPTVTSSSYTARFGVGADQGNGTGAFNTALYAGSTPANGTYGNFTVSSGVITPNGSQTVGTYSVGGWPVEVINGYRAVANQTQFNALTPANIGGKTVLVREGANISVTPSWNSDGDFSYATILGDGADVQLDTTSGTDSRKHFVTWETYNTKKLIFDNIRMVTGSTAGAKVNAFVMVGTGGPGGSYAEDVYVLRNSFICSRPDPFGAYGGGVASFPGAAGIFFTGNSRRISIRDNYVLGGCGDPSTIHLRGSEHWSEIVGNWCDLTYLDAIGPPSVSTLVCGNLVSRPVAADADAGAPHNDGLQYLGARGVAEMNAFVKGQVRGASQAFFSQDGNTELTSRNTLIADDDLYGLSYADPIGASIQNYTHLPRTGTTFPLSDPQGGIRFSLRFQGAIVGTNDILNSVFRRTSSDIVAGVTETGNVNSQSWVLADWNTNYPNWDMATIPTLQNAIQFHAAGVSAAAGKGCNQNITSWGSRRSSYVLNVATPVISSIALTPTSNGFNGTFRTSVGGNMVFYAVIPQAQGNPTYREIKERRVPNAVGYGDVWCSRANAGTDLAISVNTASAGTAYKLCVVAENGWSVQSAITTANFTTVASGITRIAVGANAHTVASSIAVPVPTASNGDRLVLIVSHETVNTTLTDPAGWTRIGTGVGFTNGTPQLRVYRRTRDGTEGANITVSASGSGQLMGVCIAYRGVSTNGFEATVNQFDGTTRATPTGTATAESAIIHIWATSSGGTPTFTLPNPSDLVAGFYNSAANWFLGVEDQLSVSAGTTTGRTITATSGAVYNAMQIELLKA